MPMSLPLPTDNKRESVPLVIVQGFLGTGVFSWEYYINKHNTHPLKRKRMLVPSLGPVSSLHDRACELFYALAGGRVDYGAEHSTAHKHARYGRTFAEGLYPSWSRERPLHFLGHSIGGPTIVKLQHLLGQGHFGERYHPDMVLSVTSVCAPYRGTQVVYTLGESTTSAPAVRPLSVGAALAKLVHVLAYLSPLLPSSMDVHADARSLSYRESSLSEFLKHLWRSDWAESRDAAPYDMTFEAADAREAALEGNVYPNTFYRSYVSVMTSKINADPSNYHHRPRTTSTLLTNSVLYILSRFIGTFDYRGLDPQPSFVVESDPRERHSNLPPMENELESGLPGSTEPIGEEYWANDGVVPVFSQWHPHSCRTTTCHHETLVLDSSNKQAQNYKPRRGRWTVLTVDNTNHISLIPVPLMDDVFQRTFWINFGLWLDAVDST